MINPNQSNQSKDLKDKICEFVTANTPKKAKYAKGLGWSLWARFIMTKEESEIFISDPLIEAFFTSIAGTWQSYHSMVIDSITLYPELSNIILCAGQDSHLASYNLKSHIIEMGLYKAPLPSADLLFEPEAILSLIRASPINEAKKFLSNNNERIRLEAYNRIGFLDCAEQMVRDSSAKIRALICQHLPCGDPRFKPMMDDRSKLVFSAVLRKIDKGEIPMMLGSKHLKDSTISDILNKRMTSDQ